MRVSLLTGADDPNYAVPLAAALADQGIHVNFIGNDAMADAPGLRRANIRYLNLRGSQDPSAALHVKTGRVLRYYQLLLEHAVRTDASIFHILWLNKFDLLDRTVMNAFYKLNRKKLVFTAHNVNTRKRDGRDTWTNRASLRAMYAMFDHVFVHNELSRDELVEEYGVTAARVSVIPFGLNTYAPETPLSRSEARARLGLDESERTLLFFGQIAPYKGLDVLIEALDILGATRQADCRLLVAGKPKIGADSYWRAVRERLDVEPTRSRVVLKDTFIPDSDVAILFKAADALVLPYRAIYQSGPLSLAHRFGIPVIATRVGSFESDVVPGVTGLLCTPDDPRDLAQAIARFFASDLYLDGEGTHKRIREIALERYSWDRIGRTTAGVYARLVGEVAC
jgi:glycosyltransferase involved in cell wall biosynthesis